MIEQNILAAEAVEAEPCFTIERGALHPALDFLARRIVERCNRVPILANVLIEAEPSGTVRLSATDLDIYASVTLDAVEVAQPGRFTVGAAALRDAVKGAKRDASVRLAYRAESVRQFGGTVSARVEVTHGRARLNLNALPADEFPVLSRPFGDAEAVTFADALAPIGKLIAPEKLAKVLDAAGKLFGDAPLSRATYQGNDQGAVALEAGAVRIVAKYAEPQVEMWSNVKRDHFTFGYNAAAKAKAREYLLGLRDRYALLVIEGGQLIERAGAAIGVTFGEIVEGATYQRSSWEAVETPCYETFTTKVEHVETIEPARPAQWSDGAYSVFAPRCNDLVTAEVTCEVDGTVHPIAVHETRHTIQPSAEQVRDWCGPVDHCAKVAIPARWYMATATKTDRARMNALAQRCNDPAAARALLALASQYGRRSLADLSHVDGTGQPVVTPIVATETPAPIVETATLTRGALSRAERAIAMLTGAKRGLGLRKFDDCFENGDGDAVHGEIVRRLRADSDLARQVWFASSHYMDCGERIDRNARDFLSPAMAAAVFDALAWPSTYADARYGYREKVAALREAEPVAEVAPVAEKPRIRLRCVAVPIDATPIAKPAEVEPLSEESDVVTVGPWQGARAMLAERDARDVALVERERAKRQRIVRAYLRVRGQRDAARTELYDVGVKLLAAQNAARVIVDRDIAGNDVNRPDMLNLIERRAVAAEERAATLAARVEQLEQATVETFARNRSVYDALEEWTGRALRAEAALKRPALPVPNVIRVDFTQPARPAIAA